MTNAKLWPACVLLGLLAGLPGRAAGPFGLRVGHTADEARRRMPAGAMLERGDRFGETRHLVWHAAHLAVRAEWAPDARIGHLAWGRRDAVDRAEACL
ncbi:MAG: hypothetical protein AAGD03_08670 [Bordetella sp.]|nr:hypothetical protein [Pseudomonadota bacterium]